MEETKLLAPACRCLIPGTSLSTKVLSNPVEPGKELLEGRLESERCGKSSVSSVGARLELHAFKELLTKVRGEVDAGLARLEAVIEDMESSGPGLGLVGKRDMGRGKEKVES